MWCRVVQSLATVHMLLVACLSMHAVVCLCRPVHDVQTRASYFLAVPFWPCTNHLFLVGNDPCDAT
jgi:hypothetical protein